MCAFKRVRYKIMKNYMRIQFDFTFQVNKLPSEKVAGKNCEMAGIDMKI